MKAQSISPSFYNIFKKIDGKHMVFNSFSGAICELDVGVWEDLRCGELSRISEEFLLGLFNEGFVVESSRNECSEYDSKYIFDQENGDSFLCQVMLASGCNLACPYCFQGAPDKRDNVIHRSSLERILRWLKQAINDAGPNHVHFSMYGGEPLLAKDHLPWLLSELKEIADQYRLRMDLAMVTNATLLDDNLIRLLIAHKVFMQITLDGPKEIHDVRRPFKDGRGTYEVVMANVRKIIAAGGADLFRLRINTDKHNLLALRPFVAFLNSLGVKNLNCGLVHFRGASHCYESRCVADHNERYSVEKEVYSILKPYGYADTVTDIALSTGCGFNKPRAFVITPSLDVYKCEELAASGVFSVGHIDSDGNMVLKKDVYDRHISRGPMLFEQCKKCRLLPLCGCGCAAAAHVAKGDPFLPQCWLTQSDVEQKISNLMWQSEYDATNNETR
jgi:uncharacterized protein